MKILFTADWHIKLGQKNVPIEWARDRYLAFFEQVVEYEKEVDLHIIGGDIFDRVPTLPELELFLTFVCNNQHHKTQRIYYDGNHEATKKGQTFLASLIMPVTAISSGYDLIVTKPQEYELFSILPYCKLHEKNSIESLNQSKILFTHVRGEIPPHVKPEVDLERFRHFPFVFAGDLHAHSNSQRNIIYPGSPMTTSFHRSVVETGGIILQYEKGMWDWTWVRFNLPQLIRQTVSSPKEMVATDYHHTIYELEGDLAELSNVKNSDLLDKKVVKRSSDAALYLDKNMSIQEELVEYLSYILEIPETKITNIVSLFNDYTEKAKVG